MDTIKEYWRLWLWGNAVSRLITINFIVWIVIKLGSLLSPDPYFWTGLFILPSTDTLFPSRFWTIVTYMFSHEEFMHLFVNMMWLWLFGDMMRSLQNGLRLILIYVYGGLAGAAGFLTYNLIAGGVHASALGASCSVLALVGTVAVMAPKWEVHLLIFGRVQVIWIAVIAVLFFVIFAPAPDVFCAHLSGLLIGVLYAVLKRRDFDILRPALQLIYYLQAGMKGNLTKSPRQQSDSRVEEFELDELLSKISRSGYASLSPAERQRLFNLSQKLKK